MTGMGDRKVKKRIETLLVAVICFLFLVSFAVVGTLACKPLYYLDIQVLHIPEQSGYSVEEIKNNYNELIDYNLSPFHQKLEFPDFPMSREAEIHFEEVKVIFQWFVKLLVITFPLGVIGIIWQYRRRNYTFLKIAGGISIFVPLVLGILMIAGWDTFFNTFHELMFANDFWLFNPVTDPVILILPDEFFLHCACMILVGILCGAVIFIGSSVKLEERNYKRQRQDRIRKKE